MKKKLTLLIILAILFGSNLITYCDKNDTFTWVPLNDYYYEGTWKDNLIFRGNWESTLRIYSPEGTLKLSFDDFNTSSKFDSFIAIRRTIAPVNYQYYLDLFLMGETEAIRDEAFKHLDFTYKYEYFDKNFNKITPTKPVVKYLNDGYRAGPILCFSNTQSFKDYMYYDKYYLISPINIDDYRKVGLGDSSGNILIEPSYSKIESYYDSTKDKLYFILYDSIVDNTGEHRYYIDKIINESLETVFDVPNINTGLEPYIDELGFIIFRDDFDSIRAFTIEGNEILKDVDKSWFSIKDGWYYIYNRKQTGYESSYKMNIQTKEKIYHMKLQFGENVGTVGDAFGYFYYKRLDGGKPDIKYSPGILYYFEDDSPRVCAFSSIDGETEFLYDANYGQLGRKIISSDLYAVKKNGKIGFLDSTYKELTKFVYDFVDDQIYSDRLLAVKNGKVGYLDNDLNEVIPFIYNDGLNFNYYGYACVEDEKGNLLVIDKYGKTVYTTSANIQLFASSSAFDDKYIAVYDNNKIGWIKSYIYTPKLYIHRISSWARELVLKAIDEDWVPESLQSNYNQNITRVEAAQLIVNAYEKITNTQVIYKTHNFIDTKDIAVMKAYTLGIINGTSDNSFEPNKLVTREQLCVMLNNLYKSLDKTPFDDYKLSSFVDEDDIAIWSKDSVNLLYNLGIINGTDEGKLLPKGNSTREQAILMVYKLIYTK